MIVSRVGYFSTTKFVSFLIQHTTRMEFSAEYEVGKVRRNYGRIGGLVYVCVV